MSIEIKDGQLSKTINSAGNKLVAVDFSNPGCPPCRAIHPFWESLVQQYPSVVFCTVQCNDCPTESQKYQIRATPTFVFIKQGNEVERFEGADKNKILAAIKKHMTGFIGSGHTLGEAAPSGNYFENLFKQSREAPTPPPPAEEQPKPTPMVAPSPVIQQQAAPEIIQPVITPPAPQAPPELPEETRNELLAMGFEESLINDAVAKTLSVELDLILEYIDAVQNGQEWVPPQPEPPQQNAKQEQIANQLTKPLNEEGLRALETLKSMGYDEELSLIAINVSGPQNLDGCIDVIGKIQRGEPIPQPKQNKTPEEKEATLRHYKELLEQRKKQEAEKVAPKNVAKSELERRKQVLENIEAKKKLAEMKEEQAKREALKERMREKQERERVRARIQAQREAAMGKTHKEEPVPAPAAAPVAQPSAHANSNDATLKICFPDGSSKVNKFAADNTLNDVERWVRSNGGPSAAGSRISFGTTFPRQTFTKDKFGTTLRELGLTPRAQILVTFS